MMTNYQLRNGGRVCIGSQKMLVHHLQTLQIQIVIMSQERDHGRLQPFLLLKINNTMVVDLSRCHGTIITGSCQLPSTVVSTVKWFFWMILASSLRMVILLLPLLCGSTCHLHIQSQVCMKFQQNFTFQTIMMNHLV